MVVGVSLSSPRPHRSVLLVGAPAPAVFPQHFRSVLLVGAPAPAGPPGCSNSPGPHPANPPRLPPPGAPHISPWRAPALPEPPGAFSRVGAGLPGSLSFPRGGSSSPGPLLLFLSPGHGNTEDWQGYWGPWLISGLGFEKSERRISKGVGMMKVST